MIVVEHVIRSIIDMIPEIELNPSVTQKAKFHWGDEKELNRYIKTKKDNSYPLIWLLPSEDSYEGASKSQVVLKDCSFVIATRETRKDLFNDERYIKTFDLVLNPLTEKLIHGLTSSNITDRIGNDWTINRFPNYSADSEENGTIDLWDAIRLDISIRFNQSVNCLRQINYE